MCVAVREQPSTHTQRKLLGVWSTWEHGKFEHIAHMLLQEIISYIHLTYSPSMLHWFPLFPIKSPVCQMSRLMPRPETVRNSSDWTCTCCANPQHTHYLYTILTSFAIYHILAPLRYEKRLLRLPLWQREVLTGCRGEREERLILLVISLDDIKAGKWQQRAGMHPHWIANHLPFEWYCKNIGGDITALK